MKSISIWKSAGRVSVASALMAAAMGLAQAQVLAIGASNTDGYGVSRSQAWPAVLETMLRAKGLSVSVSNQGITREQTAATLARMESIPAGTKVVILNPGSFNDTAVSRSGSRNPVDPKQTEANISAMVQKAKARGATTIMLRQGGGAYGAINISGSGVGPAGLQADRLHYSAAGHQTIAQRLFPVVEKAVRK